MGSRRSHLKVGKKKNIMIISYSCIVGSFDENVKRSTYGRHLPSDLKKIKFKMGALVTLNRQNEHNSRISNWIKLSFIENLHHCPLFDICETKR